MYETLGTLNIILVIVITAPYWLTKINKYIVKTKAPWFKDLVSILRKMHKWLAALLLVSIVTHGYLALGRITLNTGIITATLFFITALLGLAFFLLRKKQLFKLHKLFALLAILMIVAHRILPGIMHRFV